MCGWWTGVVEMLWWLCWEGADGAAGMELKVVVESVMEVGGWWRLDGGGGRLVVRMVEVGGRGGGGRWWRWRVVEVEGWWD